MLTDEEVVVLLDDDGAATGTAPKFDVHTSNTPLHRAFSCYIRDDSGAILLTRRALGKKTWPGVWTNSVCGHPAPGEADAEAIVRRSREELGTVVESIAPVLPAFRYRATDASGFVENEICPVYLAQLAAPLRPDPSEVAEWTWVRPDGLTRALAGTPAVFSPWLQLQVPELISAGALPAGVP